MDNIEDEKRSQGDVCSASSICTSENQNGTFVDVAQLVLPHTTAHAPLEIKNVTQAGEQNEMVSRSDMELLPNCLMVAKNDFTQNFEKDACVASSYDLSIDVESSTEPNNPQFPSSCEIHQGQLINGVPNRDDVGTSTELKISEHGSQCPSSNEAHYGQSVTGDPGRDEALYQSDTEVKTENINRGLVDTETPFESVKDAVSKFGGITDWKAHKAQVWERRRSVQKELEKIRQNIPQYKKQTESAEDAKAQVLKELDETKKFIEELKINLEKAQTEEEQVKQDALLAEMRIKEMEQGIAGEASVAFKVQLDVAKARHVAAVTELDSVKGELDALKGEHVRMINERDNAIETAKAAARTSKDKEMAVEDLTLELIIAREALESAHTAHMEAEENRMGVAVEKDQNQLGLQKELKLAEDELKQLNEKLLYVKDLRSKLQSASTLLLNLKGELAAYMEAKLNQEFHVPTELPKDVCKTHTDIEEAITYTRTEAEEVKTKIEKVKEEINCLRVAAASLQSELELEKVTLNDMKQREGSASVAVSSLEAELSRMRKEVEVFLVKERQAKDQIMELPKALQQATVEVDEAKSMTVLAHEQLTKAKEEAEQIKDSTNTIQSRLDAALKEIEAAKASEILALEAIRALHESDQATILGVGNYNGVTISVDEYYRLSKRARDAEELAKERVAAAITQIEVVKASESKYLEMLEETWQEVEEMKEALQSAIDKAEDAKQGKLEVEQELRTRRAESERLRRSSESSTQDAADTSDSPQVNFEERRSGSAALEEEDPNVNSASPASATITYSPQSETSNDSPASKGKKKKSLFPRIVSFLSRKK